MNGAPTWRRLRQIRAVAAIELARLLASRRAATLYLLAAMPVALAAILGAAGSAQAAQASIGLFHNVILGTTVFFGCALIFTNLFRREMLEQSLHFFLLTPIRREALLAGKYLAGVIAAATLFGSAAVVAYPLLNMPAGEVGGLQGLLDAAAGPATARIGTDLAVVVLACMAYGALFTLFGLLLRNPTLAVAALLGLEVAHFVLPPALQAISVLHYLKGLASVPAPPVGSLFAMLAPLPAPGIAIAALLTLTAVALALAAVRLRRLQLAYGHD